ERVRELQRIAVERSRLKIPLFFGLDVLHGHRAIAPIPLAEAGSFDDTLWAETARVAAREAAADGVDLTFAPMLDVCRDPRWGR
ncbi:glycoside hydrolase family 3 N-terminal domain-containing protein, partial [Klebsiella pneumoniae]